MAKKCKHRSAFALTEKCKTCKNRRRCRRQIRRSRERAVAISVITIVILAVIGALICLIGKSQKTKEPMIITTEVDLVEVQLASNQEFTEMKVVKEQKEVQATAQPIQPEEVAEVETEQEFSEEEKIAMGKTVYEEARGECEKGRISVAATMINRFKTGSEEYGAENGNIMEVITYPGAFAYPKDMTDEFFLNCPEYEMCMAAVEAAIAGEDPTKEHFPEGARHFYSVVEPLSEYETAKREGIDIYVIGNQAFHNDMN